MLGARSVKRFKIKRNSGSCIWLNIVITTSLKSENFNTTIILDKLGN